MSLKKKRRAFFVWVVYMWLTKSLPVRHFVVPSVELMPRWAYLVAVLSGLIFSWLTIIVAQHYATRYVGKRLPVIAHLMFLLSGVVWAHFIIEQIVNAAFRVDLSDVLRAAVIATLVGFIWSRGAALRWAETEEEPETGDNQ